MPIFEYRCLYCNAVSEQLLMPGDKRLADRIGDARPSSCPDCGGDTERIYSVSSFEIHEVLSFDNDKVQAAVNKELAKGGGASGPGSPREMMKRKLVKSGHLPERYQK